jgi:hypothetical protein
VEAGTANEKLNFLIGAGAAEVWLRQHFHPDIP